MKSQADFKRYLFVALIAVLFGIVIYFQYIYNPINVRNVIPKNADKKIILLLLLVLAVIFELLRIRLHGIILTIQSMVSLTILFLFGKETAILFVIIYYIYPIIRKMFKKVDNNDLYNYFLKYSHHVILIILSSNIFEFIISNGGNKYLALFIAAVTYKLLNFIIIDLIWFMGLKSKSPIPKIKIVFLIELWIYISSIPLAILLSPISQGKTEIYSEKNIFAIFYFIVIITFLIKSYSKKTNLYEKLNYELQKNKAISNKLRKILNAVKYIESIKNDENLSKYVVEKIAHIFEFNYVLINKLNYQTNKIERIAAYGVSDQDFEKMKKNQPPVSFYNLFAKDENRISNCFFFSFDQILKPEYVYFPTVHIKNEDNDSKERKWSKDDTLVIPIGPLEKPIGYISLDQPESGKVPSVEIIRLLELFVQNVSSHFSLIKEIDDLHEENLTDPITSLYGIRYLEKIDGEYERLVLVDIVNFKSINAEYGLEKSDEILKYLGEIIKKYSRKGDIVIRYIGDWFLLFTNLKRNEIKKRLKTIALLANKIKLEMEPVNIQLQFGITDIKNNNIKSAIFEAKNRLLNSDKL